MPIGAAKARRGTHGGGEEERERARLCMTHMRMNAIRAVRHALYGSALYGGQADDTEWTHWQRPMKKRKFYLRFSLL